MDLQHDISDKKLQIVAQAQHDQDDALVRFVKGSVQTLSGVREKLLNLGFLGSTIVSTDLTQSLPPNETPIQRLQPSTTTKANTVSTRQQQMHSSLAIPP